MVSTTSLFYYSTGKVVLFCCNNHEERNGQCIGKSIFNNALYFCKWTVGLQGMTSSVANFSAMSITEWTCSAGMNIWCSKINSEHDITNMYYHWVYTSAVYPRGHHQSRPWSHKTYILHRLDSLSGFGYTFFFFFLLYKLSVLWFIFWLSNILAWASLTTLLQIYIFCFLCRKNCPDNALYSKRISHLDIDRSFLTAQSCSNNILSIS